MAECAHCKARHWECKGRTGHLSTCCSQGKVQLPPLRPNPEYRQLLEGSDTVVQQVERAVFTALAAHFDQTRLGTQGPRMFRIFDALTIDSAHSRRPESCRQSAPNLTQNMAHLPGRGRQHSTWTRRRRQSHTKINFDKLNSTLRTGNLFLAETDAPTTFLRRAPKWRCLSAIPTPTLEIVDRKTLFSRCTVIEVPMVGPSTKSLARSIRLRCLSVTHYSSPQRKIASTSTLLFARSTKLGHSLPKDRDEEEGDAENGDGELSRSQSFAYYLHKRDEYFSIPHCTQRAFLAFVMTDTPRSRPIDSTYLQLDQENLRLTTGQGIISLAPDQVGCSVILGSTFKNRPRENTQRYQDAMACVVKYGKPSLFITVTCNPEWPEIKAALGPNDQACNRPELIARAFEAKLNRLCDDDVFGNKQRAGCLWRRTVSLLYFVFRVHASRRACTTDLKFESTSRLRIIACGSLPDKMALASVQGAWNTLSGSEAGQATSQLVQTDDSAFKFLDLTRTQRLYGFGFCLVAGCALAVVGAILFTLGQVTLFATFYVLGVIISLVGTGFLVGFKMMMDPVRIWAAGTNVVYIKPAHPRSLVLSSSLRSPFGSRYTLSYIPYARALAKKLNPF
ncbi:BQ5605_C003g02167 [Microbotryum silenes-dioicae]|uniref:Protein transport protein SFT2 n=1 Tax=Microbotryum silenes-dioicae TaxID=796604 RepID=A0A2X0MMZ9_9BASI|nr:BQ5605_C003g02167 [Microbotryum silenes-dioicae]